ncbi:hypothetical protein DV872_07340 [Oceanispirochaeta sp. M1]|nr:hypothetical protein DV872_07340 [Oceanispirochaeta sp. M1]
MKKGKGPDCLKCEHFFVTWDPAFPRGCRVFGIKSRQIPSLEVKKATGRQCPSFKESSRQKKIKSENSTDFTV